ncbi:MAG: hypothetical protein PF795_10380 [Kiritimatiellae bacterium]|jgi:cytochrome oxidase Cu insertion factor (SCO1/SenC/PrrC family)|nr:hypothetical protein [Kiritimatiellia bacterium]
MKKRVGTIICLCLLSSILSAQEPLREWKNKEGKAIQARMLSHTVDTVTLMLSNGRMYVLPMDTLSEGDIDYVKKENQKLQSEYKVRGYPTLLLMDAKGKVLSAISTGAASPGDLIQSISSRLP